jgi:hypothetical protein
MAPGTKKRGDICNAGADDCAPGNICINYCGGSKGARCYRFCGQGAAVDHNLCGGNRCDISVNPGSQPDWIVCEPPFETCDPIGDNRDCPEPSTYGCYVSQAGSPVCDCRGTYPEGGMCGPYNSCLPGFSCVQLASGTACYKTCRLNGSDCPPSATCTSVGNDTFGFCRS